MSHNGADRVLPHNLEAESAVLGGVLLDNSMFPIAAAIITERSFFRKAHGQIWRAITTVRHRAEPMDLVTVRDELARRGELEDVGGPAYVSALISGVPLAINVESYARIVRDHAARRALVSLATQLTDAAYDRAEAPVSLLDGVANAIEMIGDRLCTGAPFPEDQLEDAAAVAAEGRTIEADGVPYLLDGIIPAYGMIGFLVAYAKVGKTTFGQALAAQVAMGRPFLDRATRRARVLVLAAEDPPEYTAWLARHLDVDPGWLTFRRRSLILTPETLEQIVQTVKQGGYGFVLIASWQAVIRGLLKEENDNLGGACVVEDVKAAARASGVPWLIDAHSGKGEDQGDEADPSKAMRGASAAAGAADYTLSLRYANGTFGTQRRLSGKGRFVSVEPVLVDYDAHTGTYTALGDGRALTREATRLLIQTTGVLRHDWASADAICMAIGYVGKGGRPNGTGRRNVHDALRNCPGIDVKRTTRRGQPTTLYRQSDAESEAEANFSTAPHCATEGVA